MAKNPLRIDPTRTTLIRRAFEREMTRRFRWLAKAVREFIYDDDAFGLRPSKDVLATLQQVPRQHYRFATKDEKLKAFNKWFKEQVDKKVLAVDPRTNKPWTAKYVESAYRRGAVRAYTDARKTELGKSEDYYLGSKEQFLRSAFDVPERVDKVKMLATRSFEELKGVTSAMAQQMNRVMSDGIVHGKGAMEIARTLSKSITGIQRKRANVIARTELIHSHAEGQLDSFADLGIAEVGAMAEWSTADDDSVCEYCASMEGKVFKIEEARGMIPAHPNCRCAWIPADTYEDTRGNLKPVHNVSRLHHCHHKHGPKLVLHYDDSQPRDERGRWTSGGGGGGSSGDEASKTGDPRGPVG